jgi:transposase
MTFRYHDYVGKFNSYDILSRSEIADLFGVGRSTATYHLERAVEEGLLEKQYGWLGKQSGWLYSKPGLLPEPTRS